MESNGKIENICKYSNFDKISIGQNYAMICFVCDFSLVFYLIKWCDSESKYYYESQHGLKKVSVI
jgi:hypothetical protein